MVTGRGREGGLCLQTMPGSGSRIGGIQQSTACTHNFSQPSLFSSQSILGAHIYFFIPLHKAGGGCLLNPTLERSGQNYLSWHHQIMAPVHFRSGTGCKVHHRSPNLPFLSASFSRKMLPTLTLTPLPRLNRRCFPSPQAAVCMFKGFGDGVPESLVCHMRTAPQHYGSLVQSSATLLTQVM